MSANIHEILSKLSNVKKSGDGFTAICPAHDDKNNSLSIKQDDTAILLHCFAGCETKAIVSAIGYKLSDLFAEKTAKKKLLQTYDYVDITGKLIYQACRYEPKSFAQRRPDPDDPKNWIYNLKNVPSLPFRLPRIIDAVKQGKAIFIVEGEKDVISLEKLGLYATCNSGGAGKWRKEFSQYFSSANVILIADNDEPGRNHVQKVAELLFPYASYIAIANLDGLSKGQDVSDWIKAGGTKEQLIEIVENSPRWIPQQDKTEEVQEKIKTQFTDPEHPPFKILGSNDGCFYYMPDEDLQLVRLTAEQHSQANLIALAPLIWWEDTFGNKKGVDWNAARNFMFRVSKSKGIYDAKKLRGCGTWFDNGRVVQHNGNMLIVDGLQYNIEDFKTQYIYNASYPIESTQADPLSNTESIKFLNLCRMPSWEKPISGTILAGWCAIAPICGALYWRPHVWLTGSSGTGKTWLSDNIIKPALGHTSMNAQSNTTEAGIRQWLGINAFPVVLDETEGEDRKARERLQSVLELMRQASSETGAPIVKGSSHGNAIEFKIRSCFCLSSVGVNIHQKADASRITILSLKKPHPADAVDFFDEIVNASLFLDAEYCASLRVRAIKLIPAILKNSRTFGKAVATKFGNQRIGDQYGTLIAGAFALTSENEISYEDAVKWIELQDWTEQSSIEGLADEERCLNRIMEHTLSYMVDRDKLEKTVSEILYTQDISASASNALERIGIKYEETDDGRMIIISDTHAGVQNILKNSEHENNWSRILKRFEGADSKTARFMGIVQRVTIIPTNKIFHKKDLT